MKTMPSGNKSSGKRRDIKSRVERMWQYDEKGGKPVLDKEGGKRCVLGTWINLDHLKEIYDPVAEEYKEIPRGDDEMFDTYRVFGNFNHNEGLTLSIPASATKLFEGRKTEYTRWSRNLVQLMGITESSMVAVALRGPPESKMVDPGDVEDAIDRPEQDKQKEAEIRERVRTILDTNPQLSALAELHRKADEAKGESAD